MSASLMSCVRQNTPPLELEHSSTTVASEAAATSTTGNLHQHRHTTAGPMPSLHSAEHHHQPQQQQHQQHQHHRQHPPQQTADDAASLHSNTPKRRRRFQPLRKLRRIFRLNGPAPDDGVSSMGASSSAYKPAASEPDFHHSSDAFAAASNRSPLDMPIRVISPPGYGQQRRDQRSRHSKPVLHLRQDSRESLHREQDYGAHQRLQHRPKATATHRHESIGAADAVDFQSMPKHRSTSECLGVDLMSEALSQSHDSVFSESVTASSISIGLKAELSSVLAKKYAGRRSSSSAEKRSGDRRRSARDDDEDDDDEDLGLPRSPNTPVRGTRPLTVSSSRASTMASTSNAMHASSDGSLSMLSMDSSDTNAGRTMAHSRPMARYHSESDTEPTSAAPVLNHSAARHKMAVRPKRKQAPSRLSRGISRTSDEADAEMMPVLMEIDDEQQQRSGGGKSAKSASLPPGTSAKQLPLHASNRTIIAVNETPSKSVDIYANRSLSKSYNFEANAANAEPQKSPPAAEAKEPNGFFRRLLTYGSLKKKTTTPALPAVAVSRTHITESSDSLHSSSYAASSRYSSVAAPPEIAPKPAVKADKPRSGASARQRVQPRELVVQPHALIKQHSVEKLPPISPLTKKPSAHERGSSEHIHAKKQHDRGSNEHVPALSAKKSHGSGEFVDPNDVPRRRDSSSSNASKPRSSVELPARTFVIDSTGSPNTPTANGVRAFPQYRSDDQLFPRVKSNGTATAAASPIGFNAMPSAARFSSTNCIVRHSAVPPSSLNFAPMAGQNASQLSSPSTSQNSTPGASKQSPSRRLVEKSKSFRFYADNSADSSMHSSAGQMPSLPDLSCWSSDNNSSADSPARARSNGASAAPKNHRELINKFEINDNNLVVPNRAPSKASSTDLSTTRESPRNTVYVTNFDAAAKPAAIVPAIVAPVANKTAVETPTNITQIEDNIDRIMKFACVTVLKSPQPAPSSGESSAATTPSEEAPPVDRMALLERRQSVHEERMKFERRIQSEAAESSTSSSPSTEPNGDVTPNGGPVAVVLRKKSVSYNSRSSQQPLSMAERTKSRSDGDDQTPELMKVFARRSLKLKDTFYVSDEPMSITPASSPMTPTSDDPIDVVADALNAANNNQLNGKPTPAPLKPIDKASKTVGPATIAATALATAWLNNSQSPPASASSSVTPVPMKIPHVVHPKPKLANVFNNNILNSINNNRSTDVEETQKPIGGVQQKPTTNGNVESPPASNGIVAPGDVQLRHQSIAAVPSAKVDEFKGILQRRAEWEKRATQQFK